MRLELQGASLRFGNNKPLFEGVDLSIDAGQFLIIEGPSGCGKSSLLRLLNRLQAPTAGSLSIDGAAAQDTDVTILRRRAILVPQTPAATPATTAGTVRDTLRWPFKFRSNASRNPPTDETLRQRLDGLLLQNVALDDQCAPLSVGQRQRLALLRALLLEPEILLCDEPTAALDGVARAVVDTQLQTRCAAGVGVVIVTHQPFAEPTAASATTIRRTRLQPDGLLEVT